MIKKTTEIFIEQCKSKHDNYYDYSLVDYTTSHNKVKIICPIHGIFDQEAGSHLKGYGCKKCASEKMSRERSHTTDQFIKKAKEVHGDRYDYSLVEYTNSTDKVKIICPIHGTFIKEANSHIMGYGCNSCSTKNSIGYYCKNNLKATNITGFLYFIKFKGNEGEIFYKIGITKRANPLHRYSSKQYENYEILYMYTKSMNLYDAFVIEQFFKQKYKHFAYKTLNRFMGYTECFSAPILNRTHFI